MLSLLVQLSGPSLLSLSRFHKLTYLCTSGQFVRALENRILTLYLQRIAHCASVKFGGRPSVVPIQILSLHTDCMWHSGSTLNSLMCYPQWPALCVSHLAFAWSPVPCLYRSPLHWYVKPAAETHELIEMCACSEHYTLLL